MFIGGPITTEAASSGPECWSDPELLKNRSPAVVDAVHDRLMAGFGSRHDGVGFAVPGAFMIVTTNR
ncbi:MAG TPA: hypothetical protein VIT65_18420 [Microlunatus sp.]